MDSWHGLWTRTWTRTWIVTISIIIQPVLISIWHRKNLTYQFRWRQKDRLTSLGQITKLRQLMMMTEVREEVNEKLKQNNCTGVSWTRRKELLSRVESNYQVAVTREDKNKGNNRNKSSTKLKLSFFKHSWFKLGIFMKILKNIFEIVCETLKKCWNKMILVTFIHLNTRDNGVLMWL